MDAIKDAIRQKYGAAAETARTGAQANCGCDSTCCDTITSNLYDSEEAAGLPAEAVLARAASLRLRSLCSCSPFSRRISTLRRQGSSSLAVRLHPQSRV